MLTAARRPVAPSRTASPLAWALAAARWSRRQVRLEPEPDGQGPADPAARLAQACSELGLARPQALAMPDEERLPLLCKTDGRGWGVVVGRTPSGLWMARFASGEAHVTTLALHNACYASGRPTGNAPPVTAESREMRPRMLAGMACTPTLATSWESIGAAIAVMAVLFVAVQLIRWLGRRLRGGRWQLFARWQENQHLEQQRERILRQSIRAGAAPQAYRHVLPRGHAARSTSS